MDNSNMASEIIIPAEWEVTNDWNSHRVILYMALEKLPSGVVIELGCGYGSTPLLHNYCKRQDRLFLSFETNREWIQMLVYDDCAVIGVPDWYFFMEIGTPSMEILFIDCAPGEVRKDLIKFYQNTAKMIIVHDTEPGAEYVYGMGEILNSFKFRCDLIIEGHPQTTAVSNLVDFHDWKGLTIGKYRFV